MRTIRWPSGSMLLLVLSLMLGLGHASFAQSPKLPEQTISLAQAQTIIEGAIAYARQKYLLLGVAVLDANGEMVAGEHMDGAPGRNIMFAEGKAMPR